MIDASKDIKLKDSSKITSFKLVSQPANDGKIFLGSLATDFFIVADSYWEPLVEIMKKGEVSIAKIAKMMGEEGTTKIKLMVLSLAQAKLIHKIDGKVIYSSSKKKDNYIDLLFSKISFFLTNPIFTITNIILALVLFVVFSDINRVPKSQDFFWNPLFSINLLSAFIFTWITVFEHEIAHLAVAKIYGLKGELRLAHRLNFLVAETDFPGIYSVSKAKRITIFLSGIIVDMATTSMLYFLYLQNKEIVILKQFILLEWLSILWQFFFYMKTDIYYVVKEIVGIPDLYTYSKEKIVSFLKREQFTPVLTERENVIVSVYAGILFFGTALGLFRYGFYHIPILFKTFAGAFVEVFKGTNVVDGVITIFIEGISLLLLGVTYLRRR